MIKIGANVHLARRKRAIQKGFGVKLSGVADPGNLLDKQVGLPGQRGAVSSRVGVTSRLYRQLSQALDDVGHRIECPFSRLYQTDTIVGVSNRLIETPDLAAEFLRNSQAGGVIPSAVDPQA